MAQLVFSSAGQWAGSALLPNGVSFFGQQVSGAAIGQFIGSAAGAALDAYLFAPRLEGPRIANLHVTDSREGASIPNVYGRMRVGGNVIWAARFSEHRRKSGGGKGGPKITTYAYSLSFAVGLCEGVASRVLRVWANGQPLDLSRVNWRFYPGTQDQQPDALIEAIEGADAAPAYKGLAYVVFEDLPLDAYGGRMPQLSFEILRTAPRDTDDMDALENAVRSVNLIPGSGEFAYATQVVRRKFWSGREIAENMHNGTGEANFVASAEQLLADLPNLEHVNLVVGWFGDDLRCGECEIRPGVERRDKATTPMEWKVGSADRNSAWLVTADAQGKPSYGGSPADASVIQAIEYLKSRGIRVTLYPFVFMDIAPGNGLPDPYGQAEQAAFPWRGRISAHPAPGVAGSPDMSFAAQVQVDAFFGDAQASDFQVSGASVTYTGPQSWRYRQFILHYAALAAAAGGVDAFLIGAEMIGLTRVRSAQGAYPAVAQLKDLAGQARVLLSADTAISYAADWTEFGAYAPQDGSSDVDFPLDPLWADANIDFVGLDWYAPMADWRDVDGHADALAGWKAPHDAAYLRANIEGGEGYDWYYASDADRSAQIRTPIIDTAHGEDWIFRQKDIRNWWMNAHYPRPGGVRAAQATGWTPQMKPVRFVEFGCPAADKGANQPNVFYDPKSSESEFPHFSSGVRDDLIQRRTVEAFCAYWADDTLLDADGVSIWAWDARPFPAWPLKADIWSDGDNWRLGHWLNGRTGLAQLSDVVADLCARGGVKVADVSGLDGLVTGYGLDGVMSVRDGLEPLRAAFGLICVEREDGLHFSVPRSQALTLVAGDLRLSDSGGPVEISHGGLERQGRRIRVRYIDSETDHQPGVALSRGRESEQVADVSLALVMDSGQARARADALRALSEAGGTSARCGLSPAMLQVEPGDRLIVEDAAWRVARVSKGDFIGLDLIREEDGGVIDLTEMNGAVPGVVHEGVFAASPYVAIVDGPPLPGEESDVRPLVFAYADPWPGALNVYLGADASDLSQRATLDTPCMMGELGQDLPAGTVGRWQEIGVEVLVFEGSLSSASRLSVLNGANVAWVGTAQGWEMLQFQTAELVGDGRYRLSGLLRGQQGSDDAASAGAAVGAPFLLMTGAEKRLELRDPEFGLDLIWRASFLDGLDEGAAEGPLRADRVAAREWAPAHLRVTSAADGLHLSWVRRGRIGGEGWEAGEPLLPAVERYQIEILSGGDVVRVWNVESPGALYSVDQLAVDFPGGGECEIHVAQIGADGVAGYRARVNRVI